MTASRSDSYANGRAADRALRRVVVSGTSWLSIGDYIDNFYNIERRHSHLDYLNPIEFELRSKNQQCVA